MEQQNAHHNDAEHQLNPEANPAHAPHTEGQLLEIKSIRHAWPHSSFKLGIKGIHTHPALIPLCLPQDARRPTALALGSFDGLHAGHRQVIAQAIDGHCSGVPTVVSFWPHPREVLFEARLRLDLPSEKLELLEPLGIEQLVLVPFTPELAQLSAEAFVNHRALRGAGCSADRRRRQLPLRQEPQGDANTLRNLGEASGVAVDVVEIVKDDAGRMSSSRIRSALEAGDLETARTLLGRPFRFQGRVVRGRGLGRELGWPTANLQVDGRKFLPALEVYAAWVELDRTEGRLAAVMNLGPQPTVDPHLALGRGGAGPHDRTGGKIVCSQWNPSCACAVSSDSTDWRPSANRSDGTPIRHANLCRRRLRPAWGRHWPGPDDEDADPAQNNAPDKNMHRAVGSAVLHAQREVRSSTR